MTVKINQYDAELGIRTQVHEEDGRIVFQKTFDAEPMLKEAAEMRAITAGDRWSGGQYGMGKKVGTVPMAVLGTMFRQDGGLDTERLKKWLKENPAFVTFDKFLKN
jgi:hypothetical protein